MEIAPVRELSLFLLLFSIPLVVIYTFQRKASGCPTWGFLLCGMAILFSIWYDKDKIVE